MIKAVVFDLDDTLFSELDYVKSGFKKVSEYLKCIYCLDYYDDMLRIFNQDKCNVFNRLLDNLGKKSDQYLVEKMLEIYRENVPEKLDFYDDVLRNLDALKSCDIKIGIITDGRVCGQTAKLSALKCYDLFDKVIITDSLGGIKYRKPEPKAFEIMAKYLGVLFEEMLYVGDNPIKDFAISEVYPITTVQIKRPNKIHNYEEYKNNVLPTYIVSSLDELLIVLGNAS